MPAGTCDPASRGQTFNSVTVEDGPVLIDCRFGWDGVSVRPSCDGPVTFLRVRNTGAVSWYARLPNKKKGNPWVEIPPGTDTQLSAGQRNQLGLQNYSDVAGVGLGPTPTEG